MQGLWLGSWKGRIDKPLDLDWKSTSVKVLGVHIGNIDTGAANFEEQYAAIRAKIRMWKPRPLSEIGKIRVANVPLLAVVVSHGGDGSVEGESERGRSLRWRVRAGGERGGGVCI